MTNQTSFDYIVVGAGSSGCVIANRLSEKDTVLLLEAGPQDIGDIIHDPDKVLQAISSTPTPTKKYQTEIVDRLGRRQIVIHRGNVLGGCSSINGMIYIRGNRRDYDLWAQLGNDGWSYKDVLPIFKKSERFETGESAYHGGDGPLDVCNLPHPSEISRAFIEAAKELNYKGEPDWDFNGYQQENGAGFYQVTVTPEGRRASTAVAFLHPIKTRASLTTKTDMQVYRILIDNGRATGVLCHDNAGEERIYRADKEVIISAGTFESPKLLMLSGIGPAEQLRAHGITPLVDLPGVGQNLHDHLMILIYHLAEGKPGQSGFIAEAGLFVNTFNQSHVASPNLQYHFLAGMPGLAVNPNNEPNFLFCPTLCKPQSRGYVSLRSADPRAPMFIQPNYLQCEADMQVLLNGIKLARNLARTLSLRKFSLDDNPFAASGTKRQPIPDGSESELRAFVKTNVTTVWHPVGTCKMGRDHLAVVDPQLRVYGVEGLCVADASVMPTIISGNTNAACIMIGEKAAELISA